MIYQVTYELKDSEKDYSKLYALLEKGIGIEGVHVLRDSWWIASDVELNVDVECEKIHALLSLHDHVYMSKLANSNVNGWLPSSLWSWYRNHKD